MLCQLEERPESLMPLLLIAFGVSEARGKDCNRLKQVQVLAWKGHGKHLWWHLRFLLQQKDSGRL